MTAKSTPLSGQQRQARYVAKLAEENLRQIAIWVPAKKLDRLRKEGERRGISLSQLISERL